MEEFLTPLIPVSEWVFDLIKVQYFHDEDGQPMMTKYMVYSGSPDNIIQEDWPNNYLQFYEWEVVRENVGRPQQIGTVYGQRIDESPWAAGAALMTKMNYGVDTEINLV